MISLPRSSLRRFPATSRTPAWGLRPTIRSSKGTGDPRGAWKDRDAATWASLRRRRASWTTRAPTPAEAAVPLIRAGPSFASWTTGGGPARRSGSSPGGPRPPRPPLADRVAPEEVELEAPRVLVRDRHMGELPEARFDPVGQGAAREDPLEGFPGRIHALRGRGRGAGALPPPGDPPDVPA